MWAVTATGYRAIDADDPISEGETKVTEIPEALLASIEVAEARIRRDQLLRGCDWTQMPDAQLSPGKRVEWVEYRQLLRDLPDQDNFPDCEWPREPAK